MTVLMKVMIMMVMIMIGNMVFLADRYQGLRGERRAQGDMLTPSDVVI